MLSWPCYFWVDPGRIKVGSGAISGVSSGSSGLVLYNSEDAARSFRVSAWKTLPLLMSYSHLWLWQVVLEHLSWGTRLHFYDAIDRYRKGNGQSRSLHSSTSTENQLNTVQSRFSSFSRRVPDDIQGPWEWFHIIPKSWSSLEGVSTNRNWT